MKVTSQNQCTNPMMQAEFNPTTSSLNFANSELPGAIIRGARAWARYRTLDGKQIQVDLTSQSSRISEKLISDVHGDGRQLIIQCSNYHTGIDLTYRINIYKERPFLLLRITIVNHSPEPIYLQELCLFDAAPSSGGVVQLSRPVGGLRFFKVGWHGWDYTGLRHSNERNTPARLGLITGSSYTNPLTPDPKTRGEFWSEGWGILADAWAGIVTGFVSTANMFGQVYSCTNPGEESLRLTCQGDDILLEPGETRDSESGYLQIISLPKEEPAIDFVEAVARQMQARLPATAPLPMWTHWYHFYHSISEELFVCTLEALDRHRVDIPFTRVELDDGYQSAWGDWTSTNEKFPHGLAWLSSQIKAHGFDPGLWLAPFVVEKKSMIYQAHPEWLVKDKRGNPLKAGFVYNMVMHALDSSHPGVIEHIRELTDQLVHQWGFSMLKIDFLNAGGLPGRRFNPKLTRAEVLRSGLEAIRQGAGEETFILASGCPFGPAIGLVEAMRIGPDTAPSWEPYFHWIRWAGPFIKKEPSMPSLRNALRHTMNLSTLHQRWWWNDPDCLLVRDKDTKLTRAEVQSAISLVGLSGGMLVSSDDLRGLNASRLNWVRMLVPNLSLRGLPIDWLEHEMPRLYQVKIDKNGDSWQLVGIFNTSEHPADSCIRFEELGFDPGEELNVFELWTRHYWRVSEPTLTLLRVPPHGCRLLRVSKAVIGPQMVGDTLHISQGKEFSTMLVEPGRMVLETMDLSRRAAGELWVWLPKELTSVTCNGEQIEVEDKRQELYSLPVKFTGRGRIEVFF